jgi:arginine decarboxylase
VLTIVLTTGVGHAPTPLSSFDAALYEAGIGDANLIALSSVIPQAAELVEKRPELPPEAWGHRLYVVLAQETATVPGQQAWAGIGWVRDETGRGLFVEHHGPDEDGVRADIAASLDSMRTYRPQHFGPVEMLLRGTQCEGAPATALVSAVYQSQGWEQ